MTERETFNGKTVFSLSDVAMSVHNVISRTYQRPYYIKAEILKLNYYPYSGHCYPELVEREDNKVKAEMRAVIWSSKFESINKRFLDIVGEPLKENLSILFLATIQFSPKHGLALHIEDVEPTYTLGEIAKSRSEVIAKLKKEGVFEKNKALEMPLLPKRIAIISVETSKGYSDFMNTLSKNDNGYVFHTELFPSILQGEKAITGMISQLDIIRQRIREFDCVAIVRGGGGDVGLSCYDDYSLASAIATFPLPVLTGIGHSTNVSVCDMVAFDSFITPTEAAFFLIRRFVDFEENTEELYRTVQNSAKNILSLHAMRLKTMETSYKMSAQRLLMDAQKQLAGFYHDMMFSAKEIVMNHRHRQETVAEGIKNVAVRRVKSAVIALPAVGERVARAAKSTLEKRMSECGAMEEKLELLSPRNVLKRGYSITLKDGKPVTDSTSLKAGDVLRTVLKSGEVSVVVKE